MTFYRCTKCSGDLDYDPEHEKIYGCKRCNVRFYWEDVSYQQYSDGEI